MRNAVPSTCAGVSACHYACMHWADYVRSHQGDRTQTDIALLVGVNQSTVSNWMLGKGHRPSADNVIAFAQAVRDNPVAALLAAGYLAEDQVDGVVRVSESLSETSTERLLTELGKRLGVHVSTRKGATG